MFGNSRFFHDLIFVEVWELDGIVWFIIGSVCRLFCKCYCAFNFLIYLSFCGHWPYLFRHNNHGCPGLVLDHLQPIPKPEYLFTESNKASVCVPICWIFRLVYKLIMKIKACVPNCFGFNIFSKQNFFRRTKKYWVKNTRLSHCYLHLLELIVVWCCWFTESSNFDWPMY